MSGVYSVRFFSVSSDTTGVATDLYTVPSGSVAIIRDIDLIAVDGGTNQISFRNQATSEALVIFTATGPLVSIPWRGRQVFNPGETMGYFIVAGSWFLTGSGYLLTA